MKSKRHFSTGVILARLMPTLVLSMLCAGTAFGWNYLTPLTNLVVCPGDTAAFSTVASGPTPYKFEWWKNQVVIPGQTNSSLTLQNVSATDAATYYVKLTGGYDSVTNSATLTVRTSVSATPMANLVRFVGANAVFSTTASGTGPFSYLWQKNGASLSGATTSSLVLTDLSMGDSGTYSVVVSGACNSVTNSATLMVDTCFPALDVMLVIDRSGSMLGTPYNNARQACSNFVSNLHLTVDADQAGLVSYNSAATLNQKLTDSLLALDSAIKALPGASGNTSISLGLQTAQTELLSARHNPLALPVLVLLSDGQPTGSDTPSNALYQATLAKNAGTLVFTVGLGNDVDTNLMSGIASSPDDYYFTTNSAQLTALFNAVSSIICRPPTNIVTLGPSNLTVCAGSPAVLSVSASGCDLFSYQWDKNGLRMPGQTNSTLVIGSASVSDAAVYAVEVVSACQSVTNSATLTVNQDLVVSSGLTSRTNCPGTTAAFSISATGTGLVYQWYKGSSPLSAQTASSLVLTNVGAADAGAYSVAVSGVCGNAVTNSALLTVTALPVITGATNKTVQLGSVWTFDPPAANYPITVVSTTTNTTAHCGNTFSATRTWVASDACGNMSSPCSQTVNVVDTTAPVLNCSSSTNKTVQLGSLWSFDLPTVSDNSGTNVTLSVVSTTTNTTAHCGNTFSATRTWVASDACGNMSSPCSQTVDVVDTTAPVLNCSSSTNKSVQLGSLWSFDPPTVSDNSGTNVTLSVVSTTTNTTAHCGNTFSATRTWVASDACGNMSSPCSQTVDVVDTTAPVLNCSSSTNKTVQLGSLWSFDLPTVSDNSGTNVTLSVVSTTTNTTAHCGNTFSATRTWVASDACGNMSSPCSQTVDVVDTTAPVLNCSSSTNKSVQLGSLWSFDLPTVSDNSGTNVTLSVVSTTTNTTAHCGNTFSATRTWVASDACGNMSSPCSQTVDVVDTTAPVLNCSSSTNKSVQLGSLWSFNPPTVSDNSGTNVTLSVVSTTTNTTAHCGNTFSATRTWVASDACGNMSSPCSQTVDVVDTTAPMLNCSSSTNKSVQLGGLWSFDPPTVSDNSGTNVTLSVVSTTTNTTAHCGNTFSATRTWVASDACGNMSSPCSQTVDVVDTTAPVLNCSSSTNKTVQLGSLWSFDPPTVSDNSGTNVTLSVVSTTTNTTAHCGNTFSATRTWVASDACGNMSSPCSQTVDVVDTTAPVLNCSSSTNKTVQLGSLWSFDPPTVSDNSGTNVTLNVVSTTTNTTAHCGNTFSATRTWVASDACGNMSSPCSQTVDVVDTTAPMLNCSSSTNKSVQLGSLWSFDPPTVSDNSGTNVTLNVVNTTTNTTGFCGRGFNATRTWVASDACGNMSSPCSQTVAVIDSTPIQITAPLSDQSACAGTLASLSIGAVGTTLSYTWSFNSSVVGTNNTLELTNLSAANAGTYQVVVRDPCGNSVTNTARLAVNPLTAATPIGSATRNLGDSVTFATVASGTGPFSYVWTKNGVTIPSQTDSSLTLTNLGYADGALYQVEVTGSCNTAAQSATLTINHPPVVTILTPTNGTVFMAPASFTVLADAYDLDGTVTNVQFFQAGLGQLGQTNVAPYYVTLTNVPVGSYTFTARATDNLGAQGVSSPVSVTVLASAPLSILSAMHFNPQSGLFEQTVRVTNPTPISYDAVRVSVFNLTSGMRVYNASGTNNGVPYVQTQGTVASGGYVDFLIEYYVSSSQTPNPTLVATLVEPASGGGVTAVGAGQHIKRGVMLSDRTFLLEFESVSNLLYQVQYSSDLKVWQTVEPPITGTGANIQWIDNGEPKTASSPAATPVRFYRIVSY